ncbi:AAA family ATPase [Buttiauxella ferragutiae]|uniref:AAA family ATPase n=1 Tax=Buttiauxella ferragutiae TaxID=82989 RepID=UPI001F53C4A8|nr:AAA family ATPase [Buttiauxella ferragutiae]UNK62355.1 ATP-binding protein [Buttiauxella ferragutiae]
MKIDNFRAESVYGYLNFNIDFNDDLSFLVGSNGTGKSTVIKLIQALLTIDIKELLNIPYESISLTYTNRNEAFRISSKKDRQNISIAHSGVQEPLIIPLVVKEEFMSNERDVKVYGHLEREFLSNETLRKIKSITPPVFLGLDRKTYGFEDLDIDYDTTLSRRNEILMHRKMLSSKKRLISGSLGDALLSVEMIIQDKYRKIREFEDKQAIYLRDRILKSSFKFNTYNDMFENEHNLRWENKQKILKRKTEITEAVKKIGSLDKSLMNDIEKFFDNISDLFEELKNSEGLNINWLLNKVQIDRISDILDVIDEYNEKVARMYRPINNFLNTINSFLIDSRKKVEVNTVGRLVVSRPDSEKCDIDILSSGERQLLVIIANVMLNKYTNLSRVIIIDEPEISLHLKWQEKFSETVLSLNPETQFIMATHSPDIVGDLTEKCIIVGA